MALPITIPYTFANATSSIPLSNLDSDFSTVVNTINGIGNGSVSLSNVSITGGNVSSGTVVATSANASRTLANLFGDYLSVKDFGATGNGTTNDTSAIQAAVNAGKKIFFPNGTYLISQIVVPGNTFLSGETMSGVILKPSGTIPYTGLFFLNSVSFVEISNFTFQSAFPSSANSVAVYVNGGSNNYVHDIYVNDYNFGVSTNDVTNSIFEKITVLNPNQIGIYVNGSNSARNKILNCSVSNAATQHCIQVTSGAHNQVSGCFCTGSYIFGISIYGTQSAIVSNNTVWDTTREGINLEGSNNCIVIDNNIYWTTTSISQDFGLSLYGVPTSEYNNFNLISGNQIANSGKSGIACAQQCQYNTISDNTIVNPNNLNTSGGAGILIYGTNGGNNFVTGNTIFCSTSFMYYGINDNDGITIGYDVINNNWITGATTANVYRTSTSVEALNTNGYISYTPTASAQSGSITSYTASGGYYQIEKMVYFTASVSITNAGSGGQALIISLPFTNNATFNGTAAGREQANGSSLDGVIGPSSSTVPIFSYNNASPIATGNNLIVSGFYQRV
jgi:parallel beta-helix repeat protein